MKFHSYYDSYIYVSFDETVPQMRKTMLSYTYFIIYRRGSNISCFMREMVPRLQLVGHWLQRTYTSSGGHTVAY